MPVKAADPAAVMLEGAVAEAAARMKGIVRPQEAAAPPEIDHDAPLGRADDGTPLAPFGRNKDGSVRKSAAGRKAKDDQARVTRDDTPPAGSQPPAGNVLEPQDFSAALMDASQAIWFGGSMIAQVGPRVPLVGKFIPARKLGATMAVFSAHRPSLMAALNEAAQHDARARRLAAKLSAGEVGWQMTCLFMVAPFAATVGAVWQGDAALAERELPPLDDLVRQNERAVDEMMAKIAQQMQDAQAKVQAEAQAAMQNGQVTGDGTQA
jgi:hypothetical protein